MRVPGLESSVVFEAAGRGIEIGGDLYDVLPTDDGCWVLVGDVAGKGSEAAGVSVAVRHAVRGLTREVDEPEEVLGRVNELLLEGTGLHDFATAVLVRLRRGEDGGWTLAAASAGHPPPVHVRRGGARLLGGGTVLGALHDAKVQRHDANFAAGDTLLFCTDGWLEAGPLVRAPRPARAGAAGRIPGAAGDRGDDGAAARRRLLAGRRDAARRHRAAGAAAGLSAGTDSQSVAVAIRRRTRVPLSPLSIDTSSQSRLAM